MGGGGRGGSPLASESSLACCSWDMSAGEGMGGGGGSPLANESFFGMFSTDQRIFVGMLLQGREWGGNGGWGGVLH